MAGVVRGSLSFGISRDEILADMDLSVPISQASTKSFS